MIDQHGLLMSLQFRAGSVRSRAQTRAQVLVERLVEGRLHLSCTQREEKENKRERLHAVAADRRVGLVKLKSKKRMLRVIAGWA